MIIAPKRPNRQLRSCVMHRRYAEHPCRDSDEAVPQNPLERVVAQGGNDCDHRHAMVDAQKVRRRSSVALQT